MRVFAPLDPTTCGAGMTESAAPLFADLAMERTRVTPSFAFMSHRESLIARNAPESIVDPSINQTPARTLVTGVSTVLVLVLVAPPLVGDSRLSQSR
jgi:hypothetical protein